MRNPFRPGTGGAPPCLAGRAAEQAVLGRRLECLREKAAPGGFVALYGPPGNGKTALLAWAKQQIEAGESLDGVWLTPADIATPRELEAEAVAEAIERPFVVDGGAVEPDALERIVKDCCGYPYFAQLWGQIVWDRTDASSDGGRRVTRAVVEEAAGEFETARDRCYRSRCSERERDDFLSAAREVALAFSGRERLDFRTLGEAIGRGTATDSRPKRRAAHRALRHLGLVWQGVDGAPHWEPGIPGLVDYIVEHAPSPAIA